MKVCTIPENDAMGAVTLLIVKQITGQEGLLEKAARRKEQLRAALAKVEFATPEWVRRD
jgi:hypothetical protein